jgi:hypothetical protein
VGCCDEASNPNTSLAVAPLPNVGSRKICFGQNEVPETQPSMLQDVWKLIFDAPFNGDHSTGRCRTVREGVRFEQQRRVIASSSNISTFLSKACRA